MCSEMQAWKLEISLKLQSVFYFLNDLKSIIEQVINQSVFKTIFLSSPDNGKLVIMFCNLSGSGQRGKTSLPQFLFASLRHV